MTDPHPSPPQLVLLRFLALAAVLVPAAAAAEGWRHDYRRDFAVVWGRSRAMVRDEGRTLELALDRETGSRIQSKRRFLYGKFEMDIKLVRGESAGTIASFYLCTGGLLHDEVDFEFLGNTSGEPYLLHTNIFTSGKGEKEQQFVLWFDPTEEFHTYSVLWNPFNIILYVDATPIRVFRNNEKLHGLPYPSKKPVRVFASIWCAEEWATENGRVKTNWSMAPFVAYYRRYNLRDACVWGADCGSPDWLSQKLDWWSWVSLLWVRMKYMVYDYCNDQYRFPDGFPPECTVPIGNSSFM